MSTQKPIGRLRDVALSMVRGLDFSERTAAAVRGARAIESADAAALMLRDQIADALVIVAQDGLSAAYAEAQRVPMDRARELYRGPDVHVILDLTHRPLGDPALLKAEGLARALAVPIFDSDELIGALVVYTKHPKRVFDHEDIEVGHILAALAGATVVNTRRHAEVVAQRELVREMLDQLEEGVLIADPDGTLAGANRMARELTGLGPTEIGTPVDELATRFQVRRQDSRELMRSDENPLLRALSGERSQGELSFVDMRDGSTHLVEAAAGPVRNHDGAIVGAVMTVRDLTELRRVEAEKQEFLSIISHELRTPLTPLKALAQLLRSRLRRAREKQTPIDHESFERNLAAIERQVDRMNNLVNDLLSVSRAERGVLRMERLAFDLSAVVRDVAQRYATATEEEGRHHFSVSAPNELRYEGDPSRMEQLLFNVIGNAVKYSPSGGEVRVTLEPNDGQAIITIADEGIGILAEDIPRLGAPYERGSGKAATFAGMGVGLYVAKLVAEGHAGSLDIESAGDGKGTTVRVRLPLA